MAPLLDDFLQSHQIIYKGFGAVRLYRAGMLRVHGIYFRQKLALYPQVEGEKKKRVLANLQFPSPFSVYSVTGISSVTLLCRRDCRSSTQQQLIIYYQGESLLSDVEHL
jgi:hypothetical protein